MRCGGRGELPGSPGTRSRLNMFVKEPRYRERFFLYTAKKLLPRVSSAKAAVWVLTSVSLDYGLPRRCYMRARPSEYPTMYPRRAICVKLLLLYQGRLYIVLYICADCFDSARTRAAGSMDQATCHRGRETPQLRLTPTVLISTSSLVLPVCHLSWNFRWSLAS